MDADRLTCQSIIRALKQGHVPTRGLEYIAIGRQEALDQIRRDLEFSKSGGGWVRFLGGDYGSGKTFFCSLIREIAWHENFIVAVVDSGRDGLWHRSDAIYRRIIEGLRTDHMRTVPAFEFMIQGWLFNLQQDIQQEMGWHPSNQDQAADLCKKVEQTITTQLFALQIYSPFVANALRAYYVATCQMQDSMAATAAGWLMGQVKVSAEVGKAFEIAEAIDKANAFEFLQAIAKLVVHIGYAGLIVICDEIECIRSVSRQDNRSAAYENIRVLIDKAVQGAFPHCGFFFAGAADFFRDGLRGIASYPSLAQHLSPGRTRRHRKDASPSLILLDGFDTRMLYEIALRVREVHGIAHYWDSSTRLTDALLVHLFEKAKERFGENVKTIPRGFLKCLVDLLDELREDSDYPAQKAIEKMIDPDLIEEVEHEEAHLRECDLL